MNSCEKCGGARVFGSDLCHAHGGSNTNLFIKTMFLDKNEMKELTDLGFILVNTGNLKGEAFCEVFVKGEIV